jgi:WD40 repeat protein
MKRPSQSKPKKDNPKDQPRHLTREVANNGPTLTEPSAPPTGLMLLHTLKGHTDSVNSVAWSPDGKRLVSGSDDKTVRLWDSTTSTLLTTLESHMDTVRSVAWLPDGKRLASGSGDKTIRLWDSTTGIVLHTLEGHTHWVRSVACSPDGKQIASSSGDGTIRLWDYTTGTLLDTLDGHIDIVRSVAWSPDGKRLASSSYDKTIRLWNPTTGTLLRTLEGHTSGVCSVAWSPDGKCLASGSIDKTIRLWDSATGTLLCTLEGHTDTVNDVIWSPDGRLLASVSYNKIPPYSADVYIWRTDTRESVAELTGLKGFIRSAWHPILPLLATVGQREEDIAIWQLDPEYLLGASASQETVHYTNAKVVLVGDSGVGKSGLGLVLSGQPFTLTPSTHGRHVWNFDSQEVSLDEQRKETRETWLWDLAGQLGYRLIHQLHLNEVTVALVVFDAQSETDPFAGVWHWDRALRQAQRIQGSTALPLKKFLVAARIDRGGIGVSHERIQAVVEELGFDDYFATSAKEGWQVSELRASICQTIDWQRLPKVSSTGLFHQIKQFLRNEKQQARRLISSVEDLYSTFLSSKDAPAETSELPAQFETCIGRVEAAGHIKRLSFGNLVLLQPELLDAYASALINVVKDEPDGLGSIAEEQVRAGDFRMSADERMKDREQEKLLLIAMIEDLLRCELALREDGTLVFPSQSTKENPDLPDPEGKRVVFGFEGSVLNIYATLAVRLARSGVFKKQDLWKNAVTYTTLLGSGTCGMYLRNIGEGRGDLTLFFDKAASREMQHAFTEYVRQYLLRRALPESFSVRYVLICSTCDTVIPETQIQGRKARNLDWLNCPVCDTRVSLREHEPQHISTPSPRTKEMDQVADTQREREVDQLTLQGKIVTSDFDVFLCHHPIDKPIIKQIGEQLKERGILPWLDEWELRPGLPWQRLLEQQIEHIKAAAVFVGKDGVGPWQYQELDAFLREFVRRGCPVIPVLLPGASYEPALPLFLRGITWVDFRLRDPDPLQQLLWGITGKRGMEKERDWE